MSMEHDIEKSVEKGLRKGIVGAVEELIDNGSIDKIAQILVCTAETQVLQIIEITAIAAIASRANGNSVLSGFEKAMEQALTTSAKTTLIEIQNILINLLKNKYGNLDSTSLEKEIKATTDIDKLNSMIQDVISHESIESFTSGAKSV
ncbi:hypothetical protein SAMN02745163_00062 [Clostridium cavendishii DSM 21758]|uniref:Uncharacterized protein n=1 Tax=Clostridium cavendishii DSM 21758 TaxID=1121302 RepID=A0A1M6AEK8_9CLOT|nr:hypothetical protein [Clostridium cavendishii]SHI34831.1 hypothetical protein SAMN02745163_00062 [Clostridium cavendishii DSM 21758]